MKKIIKYPFTTLLVSGAVILISVFMVWAYTDYFTGGISKNLNTIFAVSGGSFSFIYLTIYLVFETKIRDTKKKTRAENFIRKVKQGKRIILAKKRSDLAYVCLIMGIILLFLAILVAPWQYKNLLLFIPWVLISILIIVLGFLFSFIFPEKYLVYKNNKLWIKDVEFEPYQIVKLYKFFTNRSPSYAYPKIEYYHLEIFLNTGEKIVCKNVDGISSIEKKVELIKRIANENKNYNENSEANRIYSEDKSQNR